MPSFYESCLRVQEITQQRLSINDLGFAYREWMIQNLRAVIITPPGP